MNLITKIFRNVWGSIKPIGDPFRKEPVYLELLSPLWGEYDSSNPTSQINRLTDTEREDFEAIKARELEEERAIMAPINGSDSLAIQEKTLPLALPRGFSTIRPNRKICEAYMRRCNGPDSLSNLIDVEIHDQNPDTSKEKLDKLAAMFGANRAWMTSYSFPFYNTIYKLWHPNDTHTTHLNINNIDFVFSNKSSERFLGDYDSRKWEEKRVLLGYYFDERLRSWELDERFVEEIQDRYGLNIKSGLCQHLQVEQKCDLHEMRENLNRIMNSLSEIAEENVIDLIRIGSIRLLPCSVSLEIEFYRAKEIQVLEQNAN